MSDLPDIEFYPGGVFLDGAALAVKLTLGALHPDLAVDPTSPLEQIVLGGFAAGLAYAAYRRAGSVPLIVPPAGVSTVRPLARRPRRSRA